MSVPFAASGVLSLWRQDDRGREFSSTVSAVLKEASSYRLEPLSTAPLWDRPPSDPLQQALAILDKVTTRGFPTWVDFQSERQIREWGRASGWLRSSLPAVAEEIFGHSTIHAIPSDADLETWVEEARRSLWLDPIFGLTPIADRRSLDGIIPDGSSSDEEWLFFKAFTEVVGPSHAWRLRPQPLFEELFGCIDPEIGPGRRPDFALLAGPVKWIFEIDALQKYESDYELADDNLRRDKALRNHGWKVARISTADCRDRAKEWVESWWKGEEVGSGEGIEAPERALSKEHRTWLKDLAIRDEAPASSPAWNLIAVPHYIQAISSALLHLVRMGFIAPGIEQRLLILAETPAPFQMAFAQFLRSWEALRSLNPNLPPVPRIRVEVLGGAPGLDVSTDPISEDIRYVTTVESHYDLILSFGPTLFEGMQGPLELSQEGRVSGPLVRWRRALAPAKPTRLWATAPTFHLTPEDAGQVKTFLEESAKDSRGMVTQSDSSDRVRSILEALSYFLQGVFRKESPRPGQFEAIVRVLSGRSTLVLLPTGSGKSLVYQLSALLLPGMAIVVDPLVSLMQDQVQNLRGQCIDRCLQLSSGTDVVDRVAGQQELGEGLQAFVFISPHRFQINEFREALRTAARRFPISLAVIDEAHCVSEWGHDFMTPYLLLGRNIRAFTRYEEGEQDYEPIFLGLTGTASFAVLTDVQLELGVLDEESIILPKTFDREKLRFEVVSTPSDPKKRLDRLKAMKPAISDKFRTTSASFFAIDKERTAGGLIFCPHVNGSLGVKSIANGLGWNHFYGGSRPKEFTGGDREWNAFKQRVQGEFKENKIQELVTTKSFGMGIDKPNIRYTIHFVMPGSVEAFYQEAGRAGRDGDEAWCYVLFNREQPEEDLKVQKWFLEKNFPDAAREREQADNLWRRVLAQELKDLAPGGSKNVLVGYTPTDQDNKAKALCRLVWLGVVENYSVDYRARQFSVTARRSSPTEVQSALAGYFRRYMFEGDVSAKVSGIPLTSTAEAVTAALRLLIDFAYTEIRAKREQALKTLGQLCHEYKGEQPFRQGILDYLQESEFSAELRHNWVKAGWNDLGEQAVLTMLSNENLKDRDAARRLVGSLRRLLDDSPRHIPLRVLSVLARARICESPTDEASVMEEADSLVQALSSHDLQGVDNPLDVILFVIEQADRLCTEPFEGDAPSLDGKSYIPGLYSGLTVVFEHSWGSAENWRRYLKRLKCLPYTYSRRVTAGLAADSIRALQPFTVVGNPGGPRE